MTNEANTNENAATEASAVDPGEVIALKDYFPTLWRDFLGQCVSPDASVVEVAEIQQAFISGAMAFRKAFFDATEMCAEAGEDITEEQRQATLDDVCDSVDIMAAHLMADMHEQTAAALRDLKNDIERRNESSAVETEAIGEAFSIQQFSGLTRDDFVELKALISDFALHRSARRAAERQTEEAAQTDNANV